MDKKREIQNNDDTQIRLLKDALERYKLNWISNPSRHSENEIARLEWLIAKATGTLN